MASTVNNNNNARHVPVGLDYSSVYDIKSSLAAALDNLFDCCSVPLAHPLFKREFIYGKSKDRDAPFTRSDIILISYDWSQFVIGKISPYIDCDSPDINLRKQSESTFLQELNYASHLSLSAVIFSIHGPENVNLARLIRSKLMKHFPQQLWVHVPLQCPSLAANYYHSNAEQNEKEEDESQVQDPDTWQWWNQLRALSHSEKNMGVALEIGPDLPEQDVLDRWLGEPVRCIILPTHVFLTNKRGYPVLSRPHQTLIKSFMYFDVKIFISGTCRHENINNYRKYIEHLSQHISELDSVTTFAMGYEDCLQIPLQPLSDNLESQTYEVFEKDPVKYKLYQWAIYNALLDRVSADEKETNSQVVMIVGAGRGPLVGATLNAARKADRKVKVYAVEKNPNAIVTLYAQKEEIWHDLVTIVPGDMRDFNPPDKADILVSELLGSFGDNELSPECLDGVQRVLKDDGISIPSSYTSYLCPLQSMRLYAEVRSCKERNEHQFANYEKPYVVHQKNRYALSVAQELFTFYHPNKDKIIDNTRYKSLTFNLKNDCVLHGFSGYFSAVLYKDIVMSILPQTHSQDMISWFPIYFPIREPINLKASDKVVVHFWRLHNNEKVWYEWCVSNPVPLSIHNPNGRSFSIGLHT